jgi:hypothetical protein
MLRLRLNTFLAAFRALPPYIGKLDPKFHRTVSALYYHVRWEVRLYLERDQQSEIKNERQLKRCMRYMTPCEFDGQGA